MKSKRSIKYKRIGIISALSIIAIFMTILIGRTYAEFLQNSVQVEEDSDLTYYLNVHYDGIDKDQTVSSDKNTANIKSGVIHIEDQIPDGLTFKQFKTTSDGTIGAVQRSDNTTPCTGRVLDDTKEASKTEGTWNQAHTEYTYHGLHYDLATNTVSFDVKDLQAGCVLTVGIVTRTPILGPGETRRDFYNYATLVEEDLADKSNIAHAYIQKGTAELYTVKYSYDTSAPKNAPAPPGDMEYASGSKVKLAGPINVEGYEFVGWKSKDSSLVIDNNQFTMPSRTVELEGSFKPKTVKEYTVNYRIEGYKPEDYVLPLDKQYKEGTQVTVDSLQIGDEFNGYRFLGWNAENVDVEEGSFIMPNHNVTIVGSFEEIKYTVSYAFYDGVKPNNAESYLPKPETYKPGSKVTVKNVTGEPAGYKFLGWYKENNFVMPEEDVTIYGEWKQQTGTFELDIAKEVINKKARYEAGEKVEFKITVKNNTGLEITDVMVKENNIDAKFIEGTGYEIVSEHMATIPVIKNGESVILYSEYIVTEEDQGTITNEVEIKGALATGNYELAKREFKARASFEAGSEPPTPVIPNTLDDIIKYILIAVLSIILIIGGIILVKKVKKND